MRRVLACFAIITLGAFAQSPAPASKDDSKDKAQLHADVLTFLEVTGAKQKLADSFQSLLGRGREEIVKLAPQCNSAFVDEWVKRVAERLKPDDFMNVAADVFERHFSDAEVREMIALGKAARDKQPVSPSEALKAKLGRVMVDVQSEIMGGCTQLGSKVGGQVGQEIGQEHPEYCKEKPSGD